MTDIWKGAGSSDETHVHYMYVSPTEVDTFADQNSIGDGVLYSKAFYDGFGRATNSLQRETGSQYIETDTYYDALGRVASKSNPYRVSSGSVAANGPYTVSYTYDALGRTMIETEQDGAQTSMTYSGNQTTVTDPAGNARSTKTDALGRVTYASDAASTVTYGYDSLDNLLSVNQGVQGRSFTYGSLKRLTSATNPESGTITYQYDGNGNLSYKKDARGVTVSYTYDSLNRMKSKSYQGETTYSTSPVTYTYDSPGEYAIGRLTSTSNNASTETLSLRGCVPNDEPRHQHHAYVPEFCGDYAPNYPMIGRR